MWMKMAKTVDRVFNPTATNHIFILDFKDTLFIDSTGLASLLRVHKHNHVIFINFKQHILNFLTRLGLTEVFNVKTQEEVQTFFNMKKSEIDIHEKFDTIMKIKNLKEEIK